MRDSFGSIRQMLRQYLLNLKKKKKKEQQEKKPKKIKNIFFIPFILLTSFIGYTFSPQAKKEKIQKKIQQQVKEIEVKLEKSETLKETITLKNEYQEIKSTIPRTKENKKIIDNLEIKIETKIKEQSIKKEEPTKPISNDKVLTSEKVEETEISDISVDKDIEFDYNVWVIDSTRKLKDAVETIQKIENKINTASNYRELYDYERKLKELRNSIEILKSEYKALSKSTKFKESFDNKLRYYDEFDMYTNSKSIDDLLDRVKSDLKQVDIVKSNIFNEKTVVQKEVEPKEKKIQKPKENEPEKKKEKQPDDKEVIDNLIKNQNERLFKITISKQPKVNKLKEISLIGLSYIFNPFKLFNNRLLSSIITGIVINNSLKTMRKILNPDYELYYTEYQFQSLLTVCVEGMNEINSVREELLRNYRKEEINDILEQITLIENRYLEQYEKLTKKKQKVLKRVA